MSKLFAFNVSQSVQHTMEEGQYNQTLQLWTGEQSASAVDAGAWCGASSEATCNNRKAAYHGHCSTTWCYYSPLTGNWCYGYWC
ncbi:MAG: hypothetical protein AAGF95_13520 [Chloroflexota bacterium]